MQKTLRGIESEPAVAAAAGIWELRVAEIEDYDGYAGGTGSWYTGTYRYGTVYVLCTRCRVELLTFA